VGAAQRPRHGLQTVNAGRIAPQADATFAQRLFAIRISRNELELRPTMLAKLKSRLASAGRRFLRREDAAAALEFALVAAPFIALTLAIVQTSLAFFAGQVLESAVADSSREILTGQVQSANMTQSGFSQAVCNKIQSLFSCSGLMVDVRTANSFASANTSMPTLTYDGNGNVNNAWQFNPGNPGDIVVMRVMYLWPVFTGPLSLNLSNQSNGKLLLMATAVFKNEPFQ
jgi:Flp pilus assembly protein TadG